MQKLPEFIFLIVLKIVQEGRQPLQGKNSVLFSTRHNFFYKYPVTNPANMGNYKVNVKLSPMGSRMEAAWAELPAPTSAGLGASWPAPEGQAAVAAPTVGAGTGQGQKLP